MATTTIESIEEPMDQETIRRIEVEDDQRCGECGSTEAGNCFFCKVD